MRFSLQGKLRSLLSGVFHRGKKQQSNNQKAYQPEVGFLISGEPAEPSSESHAPQRDEQPSHKSPSDRVAVFVSLASLIVSVGTAISTWVQAQAAKEAVAVARETLASGDKSLEKTLKEMREQSSAMQSSADASRRTSDLAASTLRESSEAARLDQRAWLGIGDVDVEIKPNKSTQIVINVKNTGRTPALAVHTVLEMAWGPVPFSPPMSYTERDAEADSPLAPGGTTLLKLTTPILSEADNTAIKSGASNEYLAGTIWYLDIFRVPHKTLFCFKYDHELVGYTPCGFHNSID